MIVIVVAVAISLPVVIDSIIVECVPHRLIQPCELFTNSLRLLRRRFLQCRLGSRIRLTDDDAPDHPTCLVRGAVVMVNTLGIERAIEGRLLFEKNAAIPRGCLIRNELRFVVFRMIGSRRVTAALVSPVGASPFSTQTTCGSK